MAYFERLLHQLLEGTEEICETLIGISQSLGLKIGIYGALKYVAGMVTTMLQRSVHHLLPS